MAIKVSVAPKGMGLNDFVAMQEGYFRDEGLDVEFDMKTFRGTQSSWKDLKYFDRPQDRPFAEGRTVIQSACAWGSICNASAGMGKFVPDCYGISPWGIFVRPDSKIERPEDLKDVPIAVGMRAGSHFNVPYRLEKFLPLENIKPVNVGGFGARLSALLDGEVEAASLLPPQIDMAKQLGLRAIIEDTFHTIWWVPDDMDANVLTKYLTALDRAEKALNAHLGQISSALEALDPRRVSGSTVGFRQVQPRRALYLRARAEAGVRRGDAAGRALGARSAPQGTAIRETRSVGPS